MCTTQTSGSWFCHKKLSPYSHNQYRSRSLYGPVHKHPHGSGTSCHPHTVQHRTLQPLGRALWYGPCPIPVSQQNKYYTVLVQFYQANGAGVQKYHIHLFIMPCTCSTTELCRSSRYCVFFESFTVLYFFERLAPDWLPMTIKSTESKRTVSYFSVKHGSVQYHIKPYISFDTHSSFLHKRKES